MTENCHVWFWGQTLSTDPYLTSWFFFFLIMILIFVLWMLVRALWHFHYKKNPSNPGKDCSWNYYRDYLNYYHHSSSICLVQQSHCALQQSWWWQTWCLPILSPKIRLGVPNNLMVVLRMMCPNNNPKCSCWSPYTSTRVCRHVHETMATNRFPFLVHLPTSVAPSIPYGNNNHKRW